MRVKIGDQWFDSCDVPICLEVNTPEKFQIWDMPGRYYAQFPVPSQMTDAEKRAWMYEGSLAEKETE